MQLFYLLATLLASGKVIANPAATSNLNTSGSTPTAPPNFPPSLSIPPPANTTLVDGTSVNLDAQSCWTDPVAPPVLSNSSKYASGDCNVCVSQSLPDVLSQSTIGTLQTYRIHIRDGANHDMGAVNKTLAAYGGQTGDKETLITMTAGGKPFHLWTMRDPAQPTYAVVFMDYAGPGPADPFVQPPMVFDPAPSSGGVGYMRCLQDGVSPDGGWIYFQCSFPC